MTYSKDRGSGAGDFTPDGAGASMPPLERSIGIAVASMLIAAGLRERNPVAKFAISAFGASLLFVSAKGVNPLASAMKIEQTGSGDVLVRDAVTVGGKTPQEIYALWRPLEKLPHLMSHLQKVEVLDEKRSKWTVEAPAPLGTVSWEAELTADEPGKRIAWQSLPGSLVTNAGEVLFREAPGGRGTEVIVHLTYRPPGGTPGAMVARLFQQEPAQQLRDDLMRLKREQELGYSPTTEGQSSGRATGQGKSDQPHGPSLTSDEDRNRQSGGQKGGQKGAQA
ncbi:SRPBCC family protein [Deinococcus reticulitermitis]|nr:SRPBCC family protein [Deinococcus reticulitermitis]